MSSGSLSDPIKKSCLILLALAAFHAAALRGADNPAGDATPVPAQRFPGGVLDSSRRIGCVQNADDSVVAVELSTGRELWKSQGAMWPMIGFGDHLLVLTRRENAMVMLWLDPTTGRSLRESDSIALPDWTRTRPIRFAPWATVLKGWLLLEWMVVEDSHGGARPPTASGRAKISLNTGKVESVPNNVSLNLSAPLDLKTIGDLTFSIAVTKEETQPLFFLWKQTLRAMDKEEALVHNLSGIPSQAITIRTAAGDLAALRRAQWFKTVFERARWSVHGPEEVSPIGVGQGLSLAVSSLPVAKESAATYLALKAAGFDATPGLDASLASQEEKDGISLSLTVVSAKAA